MKQQDMFPDTIKKEKSDNKKSAATAVGFPAQNYARLVNLFGYGLWSDEPGPLDLETAIKLSAVLVCLDVLSQDISKVKLELRRKLPNGGSEVVEPDQHWLAKMLVLEPNEHHTWNEFIEMTILHLGSVQNAFIGKRFNNRGVVDGLFPFLPGRIRILVDEESGHYIYQNERLTPHERLMYRDFDRFMLPDEMIHIKGRMFDGLFGYSNLDAGSSSMALAKALQEYQTNLYKSDASLRGVFQMPNEQALSDPAFQRLKKQLGDKWNRVRKYGDPIILEEGMEFKAVSMDAGDAESSKSKASAIEDMARTFRIPPHKMMHIVNVKYENMETLEKSYVQDTLIPIANRVEQRLGKSLLNAKERVQYFLQFDRESMVLTDVEKQAEIIKVMMDRGAITINEARMKRGLNPLPADVGNVRLIPANFALVDSNNEVVLAAGSQGPEDNSEPGSDDDTKALPAPDIKPPIRMVQ